MLSPSERSKAVLLIDPVSSGRLLKPYVMDTGHKLLAIFTLTHDELRSSGKYQPYEEKVALCDAVLHERDSARVIEWVEALPYRISAVIPASEPGVELAETLSAHLGLKGNLPQTSAARRDKAETRKAIREAGIPGPEFATCFELREAIAFAEERGLPVVLKTPKGAGAHHVFVCETLDQLASAFGRIIAEKNVFGEGTDRVLIEEFVAGPQYVLEFFADGQSIQLASAWRLDVDRNARGVHVFRQMTLLRDVSGLAELIDYSTRVVEAVDVRWGPCVVEVRDDPRRGPALIEVGARLSGIDLPVLVRESSNFDPFAANVALYTTDRFAMPPVQITKHARLVFCPVDGHGKISEILGMEVIERLPSYVMSKLHVAVGDVVLPSADLATVPLYVYLSHSDPNVLERDVQAIRREFKLVFDGLDAAMKEWTELLGAGLQSDEEALRHHARNITEYRRGILAVLTPETRAQAIEAVGIANRHRVPLMPVSRGRNWGQGSALPVQDNAVLLRLDRLDTIIEVNERLRYAVIEPGVTQGQLADYLLEHHPSLIFNMTGSGVHTSVVGNILERGVAMFGQRIQNLRSMEVLLADGTLVRTGLWHFQEDASHFYTHGLGPDLNGLFVQSNLGVVLRMVVNLQPRTPQRLVCIHTERSALPALVDALFFLKEDQIISGGPAFLSRFDHRIREEMQALGEDPWIVVTSLAGSEAMRRVRQAELEARLMSIAPCTLSFFETSQADDPSLTPFIRTFLKLLDGKPSNFSLQTFRRFINADQPDADFDLDRDDGSPGMSCVLPALPFVGVDVDRAVELISSFSADYPFKVGFTFTTHNATTLEGFIRVIFNRADPAEVAAAHEWSQRLYPLLEQNGILPVRLDIEAMSHFADRPGDGFWRTVSRIKETLDSNGILAPGRYCPVDTGRDP